MKAKGPGTFFATIMLVITGSYLLMSAAGADNWFMASVREFVDALKESTGANPARYFRRVSMYGEVRTQAEVLMTNHYLQVYFLTAVATSGLCYIFVKKEMPVYNRRNRAMLVAILLLMMLPMTLATVTYGQVMAALATKIMCISILITIGVFLITELLRVKPKTLFARGFHLAVVLLVVTEAIVAPGLYGWFFLFNS
jgi:hypothetical protein